MTSDEQFAATWLLRLLALAGLALAAIHVADVAANSTVTHRLEGDATVTVSPGPVVVSGEVGGEVKVTPGPINVTGLPK